MIDLARGRKCEAFAGERPMHASRGPVVWSACALFVAAAAPLAAQVVGVQPQTVQTPVTERYAYPTRPYYRYYGYGGYPWGWGWNNPGIGSTAAGSYLGGLGAAIRAQGEYNLMSSQAAINLQEAQKRAMENQVLWTNTYFEKRRINQAYQAAQRAPRRTPEDWVRLASEAAPARLPPTALDPVTGQIAWPSALQMEFFAPDRARLDALFVQRAAAEGAVGIAVYGQIRQAVDEALEKLRSQIRVIDTRRYLEARNFLTSLAREADFPTG
jgi:hypothetical protein